MKKAINNKLRQLERGAKDPVVRRLANQLRAQGPGPIARELGKEILRVGGKYAKPSPKVGLLAILDVLLNAEPGQTPEAPLSTNLGASGELEIEKEKMIRATSPLLGTFYYD